MQERKGWRKFENFKVLRERTDERPRYVFVGDNGKSEKDLEAAERIIAAFPHDLDAVFVHAVSGEVQPAPLPADDLIGDVPVRYFRTYATAAAKAAALGLISAAGARRVLVAIEDGISADQSNIAPGSANEVLLRDELAQARAAIGVGAGVTLARITRPLRRPLRRLRRIGRRGGEEV